MFNEYTVHQSDINGISIHYRVSRSNKGKPALLLLHGHPQTHVIWHKIADRLAQDFTVVAPDLRGYGDSEKPAVSERSRSYSKRVMAKDQLALMHYLGHNDFFVMAHDRGARVAHRLAADSPAAVKRMILLDIAPTLAMYEQTDEAFARAYWHWFFLIRPSPFPESVIQSAPQAYLHATMTRPGAGLSPFTDEAWAEYLRCLSMPKTAIGICEDYRASAGIDLDHDRTDIEAGVKLSCPLQVFWGQRGVVDQCFSPLDEWRKHAHDVSGEALPCGHYIPEEVPDALLARALSFFGRD